MGRAFVSKLPQSVLCELFKIAARALISSESFEKNLVSACVSSKTPVVAVTGRWHTTQ
jgi:hypothetical protein